MNGTRGAGRGWRDATVAVLVCVCGMTGLEAQRVRREIGMQGYGLFGDETRIGGGVFGAFRVGPRARLSLFGGGDGQAGRVEGLAHLLLSPRKTRGPGAYVAGGLAADLADRVEARIVAVVGIEGAPGAKGGWILETGVGGGWRVVAGWRWRR